ncbi:unnamed protein product [Rotaria sp. Silwood1]|nr:unnamed protein product [Rotaria sp. Silwood1]CAF3717744.1 unnamed protein product [Rotaria sp. Silwood1]CAF4707409.1 unnamed protein product [Rotaria sp. Silwood1]CAF4784723.1 unnamed protein product [Rotaria sp. Silwood1]
MDDDNTSNGMSYYNKRSGVGRRGMIRICSSILIPFMIGLLTFTVSVVQLYIASEERAQDYSISEANRDKDRFIANRTREQDLLIANKLRWDAILATYIKEISEILISSNFSSKSVDPLVATIVRAKTLTACRQLDTERKAWLIQFLYESGAIIVGKNPIDMTNAYLDGIDLSTSVFNSIQQASLSGISLSGASLVNASFDERYLNGANFSGCTMMGASFRRARLDDVSFQKAALRNADFTLSSTNRVNFVWSDLRRSNLDDNQLHCANSFYLTILPNGTFGRHPNFLTNGNAEEEQSCSSTRLTRILHNRWIVMPSRHHSNVGFMSINASLVQQQSDYRWTEKIAHSSIDEDNKTNADIAWNVGRCSFVTTAVPVSLIQHFNISKPSRHIVLKDLDDGSSIKSIWLNDRCHTALPIKYFVL